MYIFQCFAYIFYNHQMVPQKCAFRLKKIPDCLLPLLLQSHLCLWEGEGVAVAHGQGDCLAGEDYLEEIPSA